MCASAAVSEEQAQPTESAPFSAPCTCAPLELETEIREAELQLHSSLPPWPLLRQCEAAGLPYVLLGCFSAEGDNAGEGMRLAGLALQVLGRMGAPAAGESQDAEAQQATGKHLLVEVATEKPTPPLRAPPSWIGLYGRSFPLDIF